MANPQAENGFLKIANEIWNEVIRRDFSKRQKDIILFIWRLSYGCKQKKAYIPQLKDFELCGIGKTNITKELNYLVDCRVITWDRVGNTFAVDKDYERWQVSPVRGWDEERFRKLIAENIQKGKGNDDGYSYQNDNSKDDKKGHLIKVSYRNNNWSVIKTITLRLSKRELRSGSNPWRCRIERVSKDIIKNIIKNKKKVVVEEEEAPEAEPYESFYKAYQRVLGMQCTPFQSEALGKYIDNDGIEEKVVVHAIELTGLYSTKNKFAFLESVLTNYRSHGAKTLPAALVIDAEFERQQPEIVRSTAGSKYRAPDTRYQRTSDRLEYLYREAVGSE